MGCFDPPANKYMFGTLVSEVISLGTSYAFHPVPAFIVGCVFVAEFTLGDTWYQFIFVPNQTYVFIQLLSLLTLFLLFSMSDRYVIMRGMYCKYKHHDRWGQMKWNAFLDHFEWMGHLRQSIKASGKAIKNKLTSPTVQKTSDFIELKEMPLKSRPMI
eukprot:NODE_418_length_7796_cov_0.461868.p5 type:complete len:158 gc:universal NODE_418_length_7796_cov_0.461868:3096-3569(+)